jgi:hypothetical protein
MSVVGTNATSGWGQSGKHLLAESIAGLTRSKHRREAKCNANGYLLTFPMLRIFDE